MPIKLYRKNSDKTKDIREIASKITELTSRSKVSLDEKIKLFERFNETGEKLTGNTVFEEYPIGLWAVQIRAFIRKKEAKNMKINISEEQLEKLRDLGILDRQIDSKIDEKIEMLIQWMEKYPKAEITDKTPEEISEILKEYSETEEEYLSLSNQYVKLKKHYEYIRVRKSKGKLTEEQILRCKDGNVKGVFGYTTSIEELAKKTGIAEKVINYIIISYGTLDDFIKLYRERKLDKKDTELANSIVRSVFDLDMETSGGKYDALYFDIMMRTEQNHNGMEFYSSEKLKEQVKTLLLSEQEVIEIIYLSSDSLSKTLEEVGSEMGKSRERVRQIKERALKKLGIPTVFNQFCYNFDNYKLTEDEIRIIEDLKDRIYSNGFAFYSSNIDDENIFVSFEALKNMRVTIEERIEKEKIESGEIALEDLGFSKRVYSALKRADKNTLKDILQLTKKELKGIYGLGEKSRREVIQKIEEHKAILESFEVVEEQEADLEEKDEFVEEVLDIAIRRKKAREKDEQAKELEEKYKNLYKNNLPKNEPRC